MDFEILHLSDLHFKENESYDRNIVLTSLLKDIKKLKNNHFLNPNLIIITGDISYSAKVEEFDLAADFFDELLKVTELKRQYIKFVPGNHDVNRHNVDPFLHKGLKNLQTREEINDFFTNKKQLEILFSKFDNYNNFLNSNFKDHPQINYEQIHYNEQIKFEDYEITLIGLISSLASFEDDERGKQILGEREVRRVIENIPDSSDCVIAMSHHPFPWLNTQDENDVRPILSKVCDIFLCGHLHETELTTLISPRGQIHTFQAGASYERRNKKNIYNIIKIDLKRKRGDISLRSYSDKEGGFWKEDNDTFEDASHGKYSWELRRGSSIMDKISLEQSYTPLNLYQLLEQDNELFKSFKDFETSLDKYIDHFPFMSQFLSKWCFKVNNILSELLRLCPNSLKPSTPEDAHNITISSLAWLMVSLMDISNETSIFDRYDHIFEVLDGVEFSKKQEENILGILKICCDLQKQVYSEPKSIEFERFDKNTLYASLIVLLSDVVFAFGKISLEYLQNRKIKDSETTYSFIESDEFSEIQNIIINSDRQELSIDLSCSSPTIHNILLINQGLLQKQFELFEEFLDSKGYRTPFTRLKLFIKKMGYEIIDCKFELDVEGTLKLFMGEAIYDEKEVFVRELIQNSIDACLLRGILCGDDPYTPQIDINFDASRAQFSIKDNGIGMSLYQIRKFFSKVGRSYYRSNDLQEELRRVEKEFHPISKFGIGFLTVFLASNRSHVVTSSYMDNRTFSVYIPGILEHFYIKNIPNKDIGTTVTLELKKDIASSLNLNSIIKKYIIRPPIDINVTENTSSYTIKASEDLSISNSILSDNRNDFSFLYFRPVFDFCKATFCIPIQKKSRKSGGIAYSKIKESFDRLLSSRIIVSQQGIFVKDYDELFTGIEKEGSKKIEVELRFAYFNKIYGVIDLFPGKANLAISRSEIVWGEEERIELRDEVLKGLLGRIESQFEEMAKDEKLSENSLESIARYLIFDLVTEGKNYFGWGKTIRDYNYCMNDLILKTMTSIFYKFIRTNYIYKNQNKQDTLQDIFSKNKDIKKIFVCLKSITNSDLFISSIRHLDENTIIFIVENKREGSLLFSTVDRFCEHTSSEELDMKYLQKRIKYNLVESNLDNYIPAIAGVVDFYDFETDLVIIELPKSTPGVIKRTEGVTLKRSTFPGYQKPYILLNGKHWFVKNLINVSQLADTTIASNLEKIVNPLSMYIFDEKAVTVKRSGVIKINEALSELYSCLEKSHNDFLKFTKNKLEDRDFGV